MDFGKPVLDKKTTDSWAGNNGQGRSEKSNLGPASDEVKMKLTGLKRIVWALLGSWGATQVPKHRKSTQVFGPAAPATPRDL